MAFSKALYFTALLPPEEVKEEVKQLKLEIKDKSGAAHALKLPAHITLLPPFWLKTAKEDKLVGALDRAILGFDPFSMEIKGFGRFGQRVIFLKVTDPEPVKQLHQELVNATREFMPDSKEGALHPHITIATRDLTRERFLQVWPEFQERSFNRSFPVKALFLFRHNGKTWDIIKKIPFRSK